MEPPRLAHLTKPALVHESVADIAQRLYAEQPSKPLFHYTSVGALQPIIESRSLRVTDNRYFNDASEIANASARMVNALTTTVYRIREVPKSEWSQHFARYAALSPFLDWLKDRLSSAAAVYVGCFTENGNLLSQWRGYCPPMKGISLGFDAGRLRAAADAQGFLLGKCIYDPAEQAAIATTLVEHLTGLLPENTPDSDYPNIAKDIEPDLLRIAALMKHSAFAEEAEWRLVSPPHENYVEPPIEYREGKSMLIPSFRFNLPRSAERSVELHQVYVGPTLHANLSIASVSNYLSKAGAGPRNGVWNCGIPLREA